MKLWKLTILLCCLALAAPAAAQEEGKTEKKGGLLKGVVDVLGSAAKESLQESIDEWIGNYKGRLGEVELVERRGNAVVLEVTYKNVKRSDGVYVQAQVLKRGVPLEGFSNTVTPVTGRRGRVRLTIGRTPSEKAGWAEPPAKIESDQIELFLVRQSHPERHFGNIVYDLPKTWTGSSAPEEPPEAPGEEIELAKGEGVKAGPPAATPRRPFVRPGTVLLPVKTGQAQAGRPATVTAVARPAAISSYDFYSKAHLALWRSGAGSLPFPGASADSRGFVRRIARGRLNPDLRAVHMLQTHPQWLRGGWIAGIYPPVVLGNNLHFRAGAGFLKGAYNSDGATFVVQVYENGRYHRILRRRVYPRKYVRLSGDLSPWAGKQVRLILRVEAGKSSAQDWAVWVRPHLAR